MLNLSIVPLNEDHIDERCEDTAKAFAGKGKPSIIRLNGGPYSMDDP